MKIEHKRGLLCRILDGDNIRSGINNNLGFSAEDRVENIRRIAEIGKLFVDTGIITIAAFISPGNELRQMAARIIGIEDFLEIYVSTPLVECEKRDVKGLYAKARRGEIKNFTGISAPFEAPEHPALSLDTSKLSLEESVKSLSISFVKWQLNLRILLCFIVLVKIRLSWYVWQRRLSIRERCLSL